MSSLPTSITFGTVKGRYVEAVIDGPDADDNPDSRPIVGTVTFTPTATHILASTTDPPTTVLATAIQVPLDADGSFSVKLLATDNDALNPKAWTYNVTFRFDKSIVYGPLAISVPGGTTTDLTLAAPAPSSPGTVTIVRESDRIAAEAAATRAEAAAERAEAAGSELPTDLVRKVNERSGPDVVLNAADVGAVPAYTGATPDAVPVYSNGTLSWVRAPSSGFAGGTIARRTSNGNIFSTEPTSDSHVSTKKYVDLAIAGLGGTAPGTPGADGKSAYDLAVAGGFSGTVEAWLTSLEGAPGAPGSPGAPGKSAYDLAVLGGFVGTEVEWLASLKGEKGDPGDGGSGGGEPGAPGASAYEVAVAAGFIGDTAAWLASLKGTPGTDGTDGTDGRDGVGTPGADGKSAYQAAVAAGFVGTEAAWVASLKGKDGTNATIVVLQGAAAVPPGTPAGPIYRIIT